MPLATPSRRPKLPPVPAVLKAREQATFGSAAVPAASAEPAPQPAPETTAEPGPETASKPEPLHADVPASVAVDMAPVPGAAPEQVATEHRWGDRAAAAAAVQPSGRELEIQLRKSNRHTVRSVRRNVSENPVPTRAEQASANAGPTATDWDQLKSTLHSVIDDWVDRQKADAGPAR